MKQRCTIAAVAHYKNKRWSKHERLPDFFLFEGEIPSTSPISRDACLSAVVPSKKGWGHGVDLVSSALLHYLSHSPSLKEVRLGHERMSERIVCARTGHEQIIDLNDLGCVIEFFEEKGGEWMTNGPQWMRSNDVLAFGNQLKKQYSTTHDIRNFK